MERSLVAGENCQLANGEVEMLVSAGSASDFSAFQIYENGKTREDGDFIFYGQKSNSNASITLTPQDISSALFTIKLPEIKGEVKKIAIIATSDFPTIADIKWINLILSQSGQDKICCNIDTAARDEAALILAEIYKHNGQWKFRFVSQGFRGGLKSLAEFYGVEIADADNHSPSQQKSQQTVNLSKVTLTKHSPKVDITKKNIGAGIYKVNLNWNQGSSQDIDLDLGAYVRLKNGDKTIVQALGDRFGSLECPPYLKLLGDDRTGAQADGEWIHINGDHIDDIEEIVIFTFIYEGVPNWSATDGMIKIFMPNQPEIETRLVGTDNTLPMCAVARVKNIGHIVELERLDRYFRGHRQMDEAFGWGFKWVHGSK